MVNKDYGIYAGVATLLFIAAVAVWWTRSDTLSPLPTSDTAATSTEPTGTTASSTADQSSPPPSPKKEIAPLQPRFTLVPGESVASWDFAGSYKDGGALEARANSELVRLKGLLRSGQFTDYELYISIANQYDLLGDGGREYEYLGYALRIDSTKTGLAWHNMGKLLEKLGAYQSARVAYDRLVAVQPTAQYIRARLEFLKAHMPEDTDAIAQAEADLSAATW